MEIRELEADAERREAVPILRQLWSDREPDEVLAWTGTDDYTLFGGYMDGADPAPESELVGVAGVLLADHLHHRRVAWLYDLVVDEPRRGEGFGGELVAHVEDWAAERGCEAVALASPLDKVGVHDFYEDRGYGKWGYVVEKGV